MTDKDRRQLAQGHYARKQLHCRDPLIAWSHRARFQRALQLARPLANGRVLDYGCGDGTFLAMLLAGPKPPRQAVGAEIAESLLDDCRKRLSSYERLSFLTVSELDDSRWHGWFDGIFCMEVLEHVVDWTPLLERWDRLLAAEGQLIVSVPVETGLPLLVKQVVRRFAGWRGLGDYPGQNPYTFAELFRSLCAGQQQHIARPRHRGADGLDQHDHKGFNWRVLRQALALRFDLEATTSSPLPFLPPDLASQAWFVLRKRSRTGGIV